MLINSLIRFYIGLDADIKHAFEMMKSCMKELNILKTETV